MSTRISEKLVDVLILASDVRAELEHEKVEQLAWVVPVIEKVLAETDELLKKMSS